MGAGALAALCVLGLRSSRRLLIEQFNSALIKLERQVPYADAFSVNLAGDSVEHILVTANFDLKAAKRTFASNSCRLKPEL